MKKKYFNMSFKDLNDYSKNLLMGYIIKVLNLYKFKEVDSKHSELNSMWDGSCNEIKKTVYIDKNLKPKDKLETLIHESIEILTCEEMFNAHIIESDIYIFKHKQIDEMVKKILDE